MAELCNVIIIVVYKCFGFSFTVKVLLKVLNWFRLPNTDDKKSKEEIKMYKPVAEAEQDDWSRDGDYKQTYEECLRQIVIFLFASSIMKYCYL